MLLHYFKSKKNKDKVLSNKIYNEILTMSKKLVNSKDYFKNKDFGTSFEIFSIFLIIYIKSIRDLKINNYKLINQNLIDLFVNDLDFSLREQGIGDMSLGKYVKAYVKKFYFRLSFFDKNLNNHNLEDISNFINKLKFLEIEHSDNLAEFILDKYIKIKLDIKSKYLQ